MLRGLVCLHRFGVPSECASSRKWAQAFHLWTLPCESLCTRGVAHSTGHGSGPLKKSSGVFSPDQLSVLVSYYIFFFFFSIKKKVCIWSNSSIFGGVVYNKIYENWHNTSGAFWVFLVGKMNCFCVTIAKVALSRLIQICLSGGNVTSNAAMICWAFYHICQVLTLSSVLYFLTDFSARWDFCRWRDWSPSKLIQPGRGGAETWPWSGSLTVESELLSTAIFTSTSWDPELQFWKHVVTDCLTFCSRVERSPPSCKARVSSSSLAPALARPKLFPHGMGSRCLHFEYACLFFSGFLAVSF